jgi:hypothetical protein
MSDEPSTATPAWFRLWRGTMRAAAFCCALGLASVAPLLLLPADTTVSTGDLFVLMVRNSLLLFFVLLGVGVAVGVIATLLAMRVAFQRRACWTQIRWPIIQVLGWSIAGIIGMALAGPAIGRVYSQPVFVECSFRVKIVAYVDQNQNGLRDMTEPGIADVPVTVTVGTKSWNPIYTDKMGIAEAKAYALLCESGTSEWMSAEVGSVGGYRPLSALPLKCFTVTTYPQEPPEQVRYVGFVAQ